MRLPCAYNALSFRSKSGRLSGRVISVESIKNLGVEALGAGSATQLRIERPQPDSLKLPRQPAGSVLS
jgi:hypothetical protein